MMTPEEVQRTIDFILSSQADSAVRMDRLEENLTRLEENMTRAEGRLTRLEENMTRAEGRLTRVEESCREQKESLDVLLRVTQDLVRVSKIHEDRLKRLESKRKKSE
jgi:peptidoglycan hydrolase CwlO-like protein